MTSTAPTNPVVPNATAPATSYASAASKKQQSTPLIATGTTPQVVVGSTPNAAATQHGSKPMNGRPQITPAIPTVGATPAVAHGNPNSAMNGGPAQHARNSSVTLNPSGPTSFIPNGGNLAAPKANMPQFGYESPAMPHSTPQPPTSAPIPIPAAGNPRVPSPTNSPVPIPQTSGGPVRETSGAKPLPLFGSHRDDSERHMRQNIPPANAAPHMRTGSHTTNDGPSGRGGFPGNRGGHHQGRGGFHPQQSPYGQPIQPYTGPHYGGQPGRAAGRGGMPQFNRGPYPNSPRMQSNSPAPGHAMPAANSPVPAHAMPAPGAYYGGAPPPHPQQYGGPPMHMNQFAYGQPMGQTFYPGYGPQMNPYGAPQPPMPGYSAAAAPFQPGQSFAPAGGQPMSRQGSQVSATDNRPGSSGPPPQGPVIVSGSQPQMTQAKAPVVSGASFQIPKKKSAAIPIMNELGQTINLNQLKAPASPVPGVTKSKTPPVPAKTPTPEPKSTSASTIKPEGTSQPQTEDERRADFKIKILQKAKEEAEAKAKEEAEAKARQEAEARAKQEAEAKAAAEIKAKEEAEAKAKAEAEAKAKQEAEAKAAAEAKAKEEAEAKARAEAEAKAKEEAEAAAKAKEEAEKATAAASRPTLADLDAKNASGIDLTPEEWEIYYELMDEQDAEREAEQNKINEQKKAEKEAAKAKEEADRIKNAAENDRKLREAEAEMERLEEEKERKRREAEEKGTAQSVTDQLKASIEGLKSADKPDAASSVSSMTSKLADLKLKVPPAATRTGSQKQKPAALNLAPLNTGTVEAPQPSAALQSLKSARFLTVMSQDIYPAGIMSPNPAVNPAAAGKKAPFRYDMNFMLQFRAMCKEPPSMDFSQQVKSLIGEEGGSRSASVKTPAGSGRQNSRAGSSGFSAMGSFGAPMGRTLPPGTSSEARFAMSSGSLPRPAPPAMGSFNRPGFPGGTSMSRTPSSTNMGPNSPRQGSRRGGSSKPHHNITKAEEKANKSMPLTQGMDLKPLSVSNDGWKPSSVGKRGPGAPAGAPADGILDPALVQRKVKAALNKMTPDNFDRISEQILEIAQQSKQENDGRTLRQVIQLTFEKATDEAHWASMYARFCRRMLDTMSPEIRDEGIVDKNNVVVSGGALFRKYLLNRCQEEFERGWKVNLPEPKEAEGDKKSMEAAMLSDEYYIAAAAKRRGLGLVQFIGELYKLGMLTERIMHECVRKLLDFSGIPDEAEIESLSKLLKTIGSNLDSTEKGRPMMDVYFDRIKNVIDLPDLASRMKFMLMDVVDLRRAGWHSKEDNKGPKTLDEIRADVEAQNAQKAAEAARGSQRGGAGGRPQVGRGDARQFSGAGYNNQAGQNQIGMDDLRRLKGNNTTRSSSHNITLGPSSMLFASRSNSKRGLGPNTSLGRGNDDSGNNSRTSTPTQKASTNVYQLLSALDNDPTSPPSTAPSPNISKATTATEDEKKKD